MILRKIGFWLIGQLVTKDHAKQLLLAVGDAMTAAARATPGTADDEAVKRLRDAIDEDMLAELVEKVLRG